MQWQIKDNWRYSNKALPASCKGILTDFCSYQVAISHSKTNMIIIEQNNVTKCLLFENLFLPFISSWFNFYEQKQKKMVLVILFSLSNHE